MLWCVSLVLILLTWHCHSALGDEYDDSEEDDAGQVKGPLMPVKPDKSLYNTAELIEYNDHKAETHKVKTKDGFILTVFRAVPDKKPSPVAILMHGTACSSDVFMTDNSSLVLTLLDHGYDVWLNNARGNCYSKDHIKLKPDDERFWDFSWHEMGVYDIPAVIDYILNHTGQRGLHYIGHSMGTTVGMVMLSELPEYNEKVLSAVFLAPIAYVGKGPGMLGPGGMVATMADEYMAQFKKAGKAEMFPRKDQVTNSSIQVTCNSIDEDFRDTCKENMRKGQKILGGAYMPAGQSLKTIEHFYQMAKIGVMTYYNYSTAENLKRYESEVPPAYNLTKISVPVALWNSLSDQLLEKEDMDNLEGELPNLQQRNEIEEENFDHIAYMFPRYESCFPERAKCYEGIIEFINKYNA